MRWLMPSISRLSSVNLVVRSPSSAMTCSDHVSPTRSRISRARRLAECGPVPGGRPVQGARAGFTATGETNRLDFGVGDRTTVAGGALELGEKVGIVLEIEAALRTG